MQKEGRRLRTFRIVAISSVLFSVFVSLAYACPLCSCGTDPCTCGSTCPCNGGSSPGGTDTGGSGPAGGGCYSDPATGKITCVDTQGNPAGSTGGESASASVSTSGPIIIVTSSGEPSGVSGEYVPPITTRRTFTWSSGPQETEAGWSSWLPTPAPGTARAGLKQAGWGAGAAAGAAGVAAFAGAATGLPAAMALTATTVKAVVDAIDEGIGYIEARLEEHNAQAQGPPDKNVVSYYGRKH